MQINSGLKGLVTKINNWKMTKHTHVQSSDLSNPSHTALSLPTYIVQNLCSYKSEGNKMENWLLDNNYITKFENCQ